MNKQALLAALLPALIHSVSAAPAYSTDFAGGSAADLFDISQGALVIHSTNQHNAAGNSDVRQMFGLPNSGAWVEPGNAIFGDGPAAGFVDVVDWQTPGWINLSGFDLRISQDGPGSAFRGCAAFRLLASQDGVNYSEVSAGSIPLAPGGMNVNAPLLIADSTLTGATGNVRAFRLELSRLTAGGPRVAELDGFGSRGTTPAGGTFLDRLAFNAETNTYTGRGPAGRDDEGPGLASDFTFSSRVLGTDTVEDAFGNRNGAVEPEDFIFGDGGEPDNDDRVVGNGGEMVDFIQWHTGQPLTLAGFRLILSGDGTLSNRDTEMVQFLVEGEVVDCFDNNGFDGAVTRLFADGAVTGDDFRIEFTRTTSSGGRIFDIDAITGPAVTHAGGIVINEVCAENDRSLRDQDGDTPDWLELYNNSSDPADLSGWGLSDNAAQPLKWTFPSGTVIPGRRHLLVFLSDKNRAVAGAPLHTNFQLKAAGEAVFLTKTDLTGADSAAAVHLRDDVTYGRFPNGTGAWKFFTVPSPGKTNSLFPAWDSIVFDKPEFSVRGGYCAAAQSLTLSSFEQGVTIRYTLDGSAPQPASPEYTAPLTITTRAGQANVLSMISGTATANQHTDGWKPPIGEVRKATVVRTRAFRAGAPPGPVGTQTYFIGADGPRSDALPVLSITSAPAGLFDYNQGIYMLGKIFDDYVAAHPDEPLTGHTPANYTQRGNNWEREAHLEWVEPWPVNGAPGALAGTRAWGEPIGLDIQGQSSRSFRQKSFGVKSRGTAGTDDSIGYDIFPGLTKRGDGTPLQDFRHLRLRNYGNDWDYAMMRDSFAARLCRDLGTDVMSSRPASIYLDGEYWGILEVRENQDGRYLQAHFEFDDDDAIILYGHGGLERGNPGEELAYTELLDYCAKHNLANQADYDYVAARVDVEECLRYFLSEIWLANADWPQNNIRVWRRRMAVNDPREGRGRDGRWRWFMFDVDLGIGHPWSAGYTENTLGVALTPNGRPSVPQTWGTQVLRSLLQNPAARNEFIQTAATLLNSRFSNAAAVTLVNQMEAELLPGLDEHRRRWQPAFGSVAGWQGHVNIIRTFAQQRAAQMRQHFISQYALTQAALTMDVDNGHAERGSIRVMGLPFGAGVPGAPESVFPWTASWFAGIPIQIEAVSQPGWIFTGWTGIAGTSPQASLSLSGPASITAHFIAVAPVPVSLTLLPGDTLVRAEFTGTPLAPYKVQTSTDLAAWADAATFTTDAGGSGSTDVAVPPGARRMFVRAAAVP